MNIEIYGWLKIFHLFSMVAWMVGLFYLPRIFVYHAENRYSTDNNVVFKTMEYKLLHYIMIPAMFSTWIFGISLYFITGFYEVNEVWFLIKILAVVLLSMFTFWCRSITKKFKNDIEIRSSKFFRYVNELPTLIFLVILVLVILRPF